MTGWNPFSFDPEGLKRFLHGMDRRIKDLERGGDWRFDQEVTAAESSSTLNAAALLILEATGDSIATGGDLVTFDSTVYRHRFAEVAAGAQAIIWPLTAVGEIQVEFAWDTYTGGGKIEVEVDGVVPAWGMIANGTDGQSGCKRRSVLIDEGATVSIRVTQTSGSAHAANVWAEFTIPDPTVISGRVTFPFQLTAEIPLRPASVTGETFFDSTFSVDWDGAGTLWLANASDGTGAIGVDDGLVLDVTHADASTSSFSRAFATSAGSGVTAAGPFDVSAHFETGVNELRLRLSDVYGSGVASSAIWLVQV